MSLESSPKTSQRKTRATELSTEDLESFRFEVTAGKKLGKESAQVRRDNDAFGGMLLIIRNRETQ